LSDLASLTAENPPSSPEAPPAPVSSPHPASEAVTPAAVGGVRVSRVQDIELNFNLMVYGNPGVGKTVLAATASQVPEMSPVLFVDVEGGTLSVASMGLDCDVARVTKWRDMQKIYEDLYDRKTRYKTVVIDSLTEVQKFSMLGIMQDPERQDKDPDVATLREWGKNIEQTRKFVRGFRDLPINTIFTALSMTDQDNKGQKHTKPSLSGKLSNEVAGFLDIVVYMYKKNVDDEIRRCLLTSETDDTVAKDRSDSLPLVVVDPTMATLYDLISGKKTPEQEREQETA
jgi:phage nucleotide-binding protein